MNCSPPGSSVHGILQARILEFCHSFLQGIFPTQGSNPGLLHCRQILYHLSQQESPHFFIAEDLLAKRISLHYWENWNNTGKKSSLPFFPFTLRWTSLERLEEKFGDPSKGSDDPSRPVWSIEWTVWKKKKKNQLKAGWVLHTWSLKSKECGCKKHTQGGHVLKNLHSFIFTCGLDHQSHKVFRFVPYHLSQQGSPHFLIAEDLLAKSISLQYWENWTNTGKKPSLPFFPFLLKYFLLKYNWCAIHISYRWFTVSKDFIPFIVIVKYWLYSLNAFPDNTSGKESWQCRRHKRLGLHPWVGKMAWKK